MRRSERVGDKGLGNKGWEKGQGDKGERQRPRLVFPSKELPQARQSLWERLWRLPVFNAAVAAFLPRHEQADEEIPKTEADLRHREELMARNVAWQISR